MSVSTQRKTLLARYLNQLSSHPLRTKALTAATLCFLQEIIGSNVAFSAKPKKAVHGPFETLSRYYVDSKALKMALYGFLISAPLGHVLVGALQKAVAGRTGARVKIAQVIASNVLVAPIQVAVYLASVAALNNAPSFERILKTVRAGFMPVLRIQWIVSPLSMAVAQNFLPVELWVPFFNLVQFVIGTYFNVQAKKISAAAKEKRMKREAEEKINDHSSSGGVLDSNSA